MLASLDRAIIDLERTWWQVPGPKEWAISDTTGVDAVAYYDRLADLIWTDEAAEYDPLTVRRLRRLIGSRTGKIADSP